MADAQACAGRVERLRELMAERGYDAVILRNNPDLRWLTGAERTFDDEVAHTAVITATGQWLHTDSRYYNTFVERLGADTAWALDMDTVDPAAWAAARLAAERVRVAAVEDTCDLAFYDALLVELSRAGVACLTPRLHGDICDLRMVKDAEEVDLMRRAQEITDEAFAHICEFIKVGMSASRRFALSWRTTCSLTAPTPSPLARSSPPAPTAPTPTPSPVSAASSSATSSSWTTAPATTTIMPT